MIYVYSMGRAIRYYPERPALSLDRIERSYNTVQRTKRLVDVAQQVVKLRQESERLAENQLSQGEVLVSDRRQATAAKYKAQADLVQANLGYLLAWAELEQAAGRTPEF
jgi:outer membrane protein TolC